MLHVTVCTPESFLHREHMLALLGNTRSLGIRTVVLAHERLWTKYYHFYKILLLNRFLQKIPDDEIVLFTDALDVCFINDASERSLCDAFRTLARPVLFSGESNCYPAKLKTRLPTTDGPYPFLNSGGIIGYAGALRGITATLANPVRLPLQRLNDQSSYFVYYIHHPEKVEIDRTARIFQSAYQPTDLKLQSGGIGNIYSDKLPYILHFNGGKSLLRRLFKPDDKLSSGIAEHVAARGYIPSPSILDEIHRIKIDDYIFSSSTQSSIVVFPHKPFPADLPAILCMMGIKKLDSPRRALKRITVRNSAINDADIGQ